ncbi:MAG: helix-turn-helix transcriptional regulator [Pseudomonadota bacterium]|nr:helix-turn-helix transcriptional regulator [Pseudomonadota bacterium]
MSIGFYELLQVAADAPADVVRAAYQEQVAQVVRKLRAAEARQQDVAAIEARRAALAEAWGVLSDPLRRRRYDRYRELARGVLPTEPEDLWAQAGPSMIDPAAAAALHVVRTLTDLRVGEPVSEIGVADPEVSGVHVRADRRGEGGRHAEARAAEPRQTDGGDGRPAEARPSEVRPGEPRVQVRLADTPRAPEGGPAVRSPEVRSPEVPPALVVPAPSMAPGGRRPEPPRPAPAPVSSLSIDRNVAAEDLARLLDQFGPTGAFLRATRELRRSTLPQLSATTRISLRFLDAMERDAYTDLPGATFVRGYLKMVVRALEAIPAGSEVDEFIEGYMSRFYRARG